MGDIYQRERERDVTYFEGRDYILGKQYQTVLVNYASNVFSLAEYTCTCNRKNERNIDASFSYPVSARTGKKYYRTS